MLDIFIDGDGCPVKDEAYRVAERYELQVTVVSNSWMRTPDRDWIRLVVVENLFDATDDWIAENVERDDLVITADIPLAKRCIDRGARVIGHRGDEFDEDSVTSALAMRDLLSHLRDLGEITSGPSAFDKRDRSRFLQRMDQTIQSIRRGRPSR
ncbi:MAG: YaiI/YqxD family protein [Planctomycetes bacterium]|nr:YaiI/YqxD family protein [Planctomycetota bacterium]